jgi:hypothetical protein
MSSRPELKIDWCTHEAAKYAVENWHYSKSLPAGKSAKVGAWENGRFIGCVFFSLGANPHLASPYGIGKFEACELTRVALNKHITPVSKIIAIAIRMLKVQSPGLKLVVSYADDGQGHHGGIYQAGNWLFVGTHSGERNVIVNGKRIHSRQAYSLYGTSRPPGSTTVKASSKHKYLMPLDEAMRKQIEPLRKPYPKRVRSVDSDTSGDQPEVGGANPTRTLSDSQQTSEDITQ